eukprot:10504124-Alexandrium_andersonii.AAC.1
MLRAASVLRSSAPLGAVRRFSALLSLRLRPPKSAEERRKAPSSADNCITRARPHGQQHSDNSTFSNVQ